MQEELGTYDFHARMYDPMLGRTWTHDPHSDGYYNLSPYSWVGNNPIRSIDPDGKDFMDALNSLVEVAKDLVSSDTYKEIGKGFSEAGTRVGQSVKNAFKSIDGKAQGDETFTTGSKDDVKEFGIVPVGEDASTKDQELSTANKTEELNTDEIDPQKIQSEGFGIKKTKTYKTGVDASGDSTVLRDNKGNPVIAPKMKNGGYSLSNSKTTVNEEDSAKYNINEYSGYNPPN